jgi:hypothetical protein
MAPCIVLLVDHPQRVEVVRNWEAATKKGGVSSDMLPSLTTRDVDVCCTVNLVLPSL